MPALGAAAWVGGLVARWVPVPVAVALGLALLAALLGSRRRLGPRRWLTAAGVLLVLASVAWVGVVRQAQVTHNPVAGLAAEGAVSTVEGTVTTDPRVSTGQFGEQVLVRLEVRRVTGRGATYTLATPVLVIADSDWRGTRLGSTVQASGRLATSRGPDVA